MTIYSIATQLTPVMRTKVAKGTYPLSVHAEKEFSYNLVEKIEMIAP